MIIDTDHTTAICTCGYLYTFTSNRELKLKERLHEKFCNKPPISEDFKEALVDVRKLLNLKDRM